MKKKNKKKSIWFVIWGVIFICSGFTHISESILTAVASVIIGIVLIYVWYPKTSNSKEVTQNQADECLVRGDNLPLEYADVDRLWEIVDESLSIITTTVNPDTFFSRFNLIFEMIEKIIEQDKNASLARGELEKLKQSKPQFIDKFIDIMWEDTQKRMQSLKTERGKINRVDCYKKKLQKYESEMTTDNIHRYKSKQFDR